MEEGWNSTIIRLIIIERVDDYFQRVRLLCNAANSTQRLSKRELF